MTHHRPGFDVTHALEEVTVPAYVIDRNGCVRWQNRGSVAAVGDLTGRLFTRAIAAEDQHRARSEFAKTLIGERAPNEYSLAIISTDGMRRTVRVSSVPLWKDGEIVGVFGVAYPAGRSGDGDRAVDAAAQAELTARQYEVLALLADGLGTGEIAARLGVAEETARNHIRALFRELGVHSRLEAVVRAYRLGLLHPRRDD